MKRFALLGHNIGYSLSPKLHTVVYRHYGIDAKYELVDVPPENLPAAVARLTADFDGFNITKPYKLDILPYLAECHADAVNTVVNRGGKLIGYGTDGYGFMRDFCDTFDPQNKRVLVLGAGGVAKIIVPTLLRLGARVDVYNRTAERAKELCDRYGANMFDGRPPQLLVNCTSCGLRKGDNPLFDGLDLSALEGAYDTIYAPPETALLKQCRMKGATTKNGLGMLVWQALKACEHFCGLAPDAELAKQIIQELS